jgi:GNAT superfamily N-acetyltransferase/DNA-binding MarR family transcriptional regulator
MDRPFHALHSYGGLLLGSRLRRLSEQLYAGVDEIYRDHGVTIPSRAFPLLMMIRDDGNLRVGELAARLGHSHVAVSRLMEPLAKAEIIYDAHARGDYRTRMVYISSKGRALLARLEPVWRAVIAAVDGLTSGSAPMLDQVRAMELALETRGFADRIRDELATSSAAVEIIPFEARYAADFERLNVEWLEKYFYVEPIDREVLSQPEAAIIDKGGQILLARQGDVIVGTAALMRHRGGRYELSKMAVTERSRRLGIGRKLLDAAIARYRRLRDGKQLFLETNHKLAPAIALYESSGFQRAERPRGAVHYARSDVYMIWRD